MKHEWYCGCPHPRNKNKGICKKCGGKRVSIP